MTAVQEEVEIAVAPARAEGEAVESCYWENCSSLVIGHCPQCGRPYCHRHGGEAGGYGQRCKACLDSVMALLVACYHQADRLTEAESSLQPRVDETGHGDDARYYLGLIYAEQGEPDRALTELEAVLQNRPDDELVKEAVAKVLCVRAARWTAAGDYAAASQDLRRAVQLNSHLQDVHRYLAILENINAFTYIEQGHLTEAAVVWEEEQDRSPQNYRIAHNLAILYYRLATELEEKGGDGADEAWRKAIANWAMVLKTDAFWQEWMEGRAACVGRVDDATIEDLRKRLENRLRADFREYYSRYSQAQRAADAARHQEYQVLFALEIRAAQAMRELARASDAPPVCCGPMMLERWRHSPAGRQAVEAILSNYATQRDAQRLQTYLSPLGRIHVLLEDNWKDQAINELEQILKKEPANQEAKRLMVTALKEKGQELIEADRCEEALALLERALTYGLDKTKLQSLIARACVKQAHQLSQVEKVDEAIGILERGLRSAPDHGDIKDNLCACYAERARQRNNAKPPQFDAAIKDLERALEIDPESAQARQFMQVVLMNKAHKLAERHSYDQAIGLAHRAEKYGELTPDYRKFLAHLYNQRGVRKWNRYDRWGARQDFQQAFRYDPFDPTIRQNLINAGGVADLDAQTLLELLLQQGRR